MSDSKQPGDGDDEETPRDAEAADGSRVARSLSNAGQPGVPDDTDRTRILPKDQNDDDLRSLPLPDDGDPDRTRIGGVGATQSERPPVAIGALINNNYIVREQLKSGGMGEVYRGENKFTGDPVAIKVVLQSFADDPSIAALFKREARILGQLADDVIVRYHNFVHDPDIDRYCLIMEFVDGITLSDRMVEEGPLPADDARNLFRRLARGLERAHSRDVIHRDLSPDNVMLRGGSVDHPVLIDFGIAKAAELAEGALDGRFAGKFKFVSPEQLGHYGGEIGPRSDVYSLALMMAAAFRGTPIDMGNSVDDAVDARSAIPELRGVPPAFQPLLSFMLEPDPERRPAGMSDVIQLLDNPRKVPTRYSFGVAGLSAGPGQLPLQSATGLKRPPVGGGEGPPVSSVSNSSATPAPHADPQRIPKRSWGWLRWAVPLFLLFLGAIGFEAQRRGLFTPVAPVEIAAELPELRSAAPALSPEAAFIGGFELEPCVLAVAGGRNRIAVFASTPGAADRLVTEYEERFATRPFVSEQLVTAEQCPVLQFVGDLPAGAAPHGLALTGSSVQSGDTIAGKVGGVGDRAIWLALITPAGGVHNLTSRLRSGTNDTRSFSFGLGLGDAGEPTPQIILSLASDVPLISTAVVDPGTAANELLEAVADEIRRRDIGVSASIARLTLVPSAVP